MAHAVNEKIVTELTQRYKGLKNCIFINYQPLKAQQATDLRSYLREEGFKINILKNTLAKRILQQINLTSAQQFLDGPTALIYPLSMDKGNDPIQLAKKTINWRNKQKGLQIKGGILEGQLVTQPQIKEIAAFPPRAIILSQLAGVFNTPLSSLAGCLIGLINKLGYLLQALSDKKEKNTT